MSYRRSERRASLIVRNLPLDTRKDEVLDIFSEYGRVKDVYLPLNHYTRKFQGFGFVEFEDMRDADDAVRALDGSTFGGRTITVQWSKEDRKTPREMIRREHDDYRGRRDYRDDHRGGYGYEDRPRRRSRTPPPRRRDHSRTPPPRRRDSRSPPPRSPRARSPVPLSPPRRSLSPRPRRSGSRENGRNDDLSPPRRSPDDDVQNRSPSPRDRDDDQVSN